MEIICGNCGPINEHKKSCPLSKDVRIKELEEREIVTLDKQAKENMRVDGLLAALRADLAAANAAKEEAEGKLCTAREALENAEKAINDSIRMEQPGFDMPPEPATQRDHEAAQICGMIQDVFAALSSSPCRHEAALSALRARCGNMEGILSMMHSEWSGQGTLDDAVMRMAHKVRDYLLKEGK
jgi:hypothetical protein